MNLVFNKQLPSNKSINNFVQYITYFTFFLYFSLLMFYAKSAEADTQFQNRFKIRTGLDLGGTIPNTDKWLYTLYLETRFTDSKAKFEEAFETIGIGYMVRPDLILWVGQEEYQDIVRGDTKLIFPEHRSWQAIQWNFYSGESMQWSLYNRFEERVLPFADQKLQFRIVPQINLTLPNVIKDKYSLVFFERMYFATAPGAQAIQENRVFAGVQFPTSKRTSLRIGYLNQLQNLSTTKREFDHNLQAVLTVKMPWDVKDA